MPKAAKKTLDEQLKSASLRFAEEIAKIVRDGIADEIVSMIQSGPLSGNLSASGAVNTRPRKKRKPMSAAAKKVLSEKMKARWAARKKEARGR